MTRLIYGTSETYYLINKHSRKFSKTSRIISSRVFAFKMSKQMETILTIPSPLSIWRSIAIEAPKRMRRRRVEWSEDSQYFRSQWTEITLAHLFRLFFRPFPWLMKARDEKVRKIRDFFQISKYYEWLCIEQQKLDRIQSRIVLEKGINLLPIHDPRSARYGVLRVVQDDRAGRFVTTHYVFFAILKHWN